MNWMSTRSQFGRSPIGTIISLIFSLKIRTRIYYGFQHSCLSYPVKEILMKCSLQWLIAANWEPKSSKCVCDSLLRLRCKQLKIHLGLNLVVLSNVINPDIYGYHGRGPLHICMFMHQASPPWMGWVISYHTLWWMWLLIHAGIKAFNGEKIHHWWRFSYWS